MYFILAGLMVHMTVTLYTWVSAFKVSNLQPPSGSRYSQFATPPQYDFVRSDGLGFAMCDRYVPPHEVFTVKPWWALSSVWFLVTNVLFDAIVVGASTWRLLKHARGPTGFAATSKMLFTNGIHYCVAVCAVNASELIVSTSTPV